MNTDQFYHINLCINTQVIEEGLKVLLHLDAVVLKLCHREDAHFAILPYLQQVQIINKTFKTLAYPQQ